MCSRGRTALPVSEKGPRERVWACEAVHAEHPDCILSVASPVQARRRLSNRNAKNHRNQSNQIELQKTIVTNRNQIVIKSSHIACISSGIKPDVPVLIDTDGYRRNSRSMNMHVMCQCMYIHCTVEKLCDAIFQMKNSQNSTWTGFDIIFLLSFDLVKIRGTCGKSTPFYCVRIVAYFQHSTVECTQ